MSFVSFNVCQREERQKMAVLRMNRMKHISEAPEDVQRSMLPKGAVVAKDSGDGSPNGGGSSTSASSGSP